MLAALFTNNLLVQGVVRGLIYALVAIGIVLVYRSSRVINFAVGALGVPCSALLLIMAGSRGWPYWPSFAAALAVGALAGSVVELSVIRRLAKAPRVIVLVATLGVAEFAQAVNAQLPVNRVGALQVSFPTPFDTTWEPGRGVTVTGAQLLVLVTVPLVTAALWWLLSRTAFGDAVRAAATNADLARMTGISPKLLANAIWAIAGVLSTLAVILTQTIDPSTSSNAASLGPQTLVLGLAGALIGRMRSFPLAALGGIAVGVGYQLLTFNFTSETGLMQLVVFLGVVVIVALVSRGEDTGGESFQFAPRASAIPERMRSVWWVRRIPTLVVVASLAVAATLPLLTDLSARHQTWAKILGFALCVGSVAVLTGWAGQLSLGQMAFAGIGALTAATLSRGLAANVGWHDTRLVNGRLLPVAFPWTLLLGAAAAALVATVIGMGALRVRGLLLAVSTIAFAVAAELYLYNRPFFTGGSSTVSIRRADLGPFEISHLDRAYYYFCLVVVALVFLVAGHLRRSGVGRAIIGVRENEHAAAAMTVSPTRAKLTAFALSGFMAGLGGGLLGAIDASFSPTAQSSFFTVSFSLQVVSVAVIGGLGSLSGAVIGAVFFQGLRAFFPGSPNVLLWTSSVGLLIVLLYFPGGLVQIGYFARDGLLRWWAGRMPDPPAKSTVDPPAAVARVADRSAVPRNTDGSTLAARGLTVRFGGLVAVDGVDFHAMPNEVVGLIGTNGAGKSTLLDAIGGYTPSTGEVHLLGRDVTGRPAHQRARLGLGRTFQAATLYPELTVRETVLLALEARHRTGFWSTALFLPPAFRAERTRRSEAGELIDFLGLGRYGDRYVAELSTGTRRIVELAAMLAVAPRVICLDEPTAGVAQREAEAFGPLIKRLQHELDATLVIVEHDMPMIMSISDRIYCLEAGGVIAQGRPDEVRNDAAVIASYLGTDARAIERSDRR